MYRRSKFLEVLLEVRQQMARDADYDVDLFAEMIRSGSISMPPAKTGDDAGTARPVRRGASHDGGPSAR
ncbi:MAG: hypothetical protein ABI791_00570 [Acidobacteriota bacterium]